MVKRKKIRSSVKVDSYRGQVGASLDRLPPEIIFRILKFLNEDTNVCRDLPYGQSRHIDLNLRQICPTFYYLLQPFYWESVSLNKINMGTLPELFKQYRNLPKWIKHIQITSKARFDSFKQKEEFGQAFNRILMRASNLEACTLNDSSLVNLLNSQFQHLTHLQLETCRAQNLCLILNRFSVLKSLDFDTFVEGPVDIASGKQVSLTTTLPDSLISFATVTCSILKHFPKLLFNPEVKLETLQISTDFLKVQWWSLLFTQTNITKFCQFKILQVRQMRPDVPFEFPSEHLNSLALLSHNFILRLSTPYVFVQIEALANFVHQIKTLDEIIFDDCRILNPDTFYRVADGEPAVNPNSFDLYETVEVFRGYLGRILFALDRTVEEFSEFKVSMIFPTLNKPFEIWNKGIREKSLLIGGQGTLIKVTADFIREILTPVQYFTYSLWDMRIREQEAEEGDENDSDEEGDENDSEVEGEEENDPQVEGEEEDNSQIEGEVIPQGGAVALYDGAFEED